MTHLKGLLARAKSRFRPPDPSDHVEFNRASWDAYAARWRSRGFRRSLEARGIETEGFNVLGEEWTQTDAAMQGVIAEWILPYVSADSEVAEIGVGGGRVALELAGHVRRLYGFDISTEMLRRASEALAPFSNVELEALGAPRLPDRLGGKLDFVFSFDVFVHLDLHTQWKYVQEMERVLKPGGHAFFHTTNLTAPGGWKRFSSQERYTLDGHYFITPEVVRTLVSHTDLSVVRESEPDPANHLLNRDYLILLEK